MIYYINIYNLSLFSCFLFYLIKLYSYMKHYNVAGESIEYKYLY